MWCFWRYLPHNSLFFRLLRTIKDHAAEVRYLWQMEMPLAIPLFGVRSGGKRHLYLPLKGNNYKPNKKRRINKRYELKMPSDKDQEDFSDYIKEMQFNLRDGEFVVKALDAEEGYHVVLHGEKIEWFKTAYRPEYFRTPLLTNRRLLFLKEKKIDYEIPLDNIQEAIFKSTLGTNARIRLDMKDGGVLHIVFESISSRVFLGNAMENAGAERLSKDWIEAINFQIKNEAGSVTYLPPPPLGNIPACSQCGQPLIFVQQYSRWYCYKCQRYS
jgi:hypothetical protein